MSCHGNDLFVLSRSHVAICRNAFYDNFIPHHAWVQPSHIHRESSITYVCAYARNSQYFCEALRLYITCWLQEVFQAWYAIWHLYHWHEPLLLCHWQDGHQKLCIFHCTLFSLIASVTHWVFSKSVEITNHTRIISISWWRQWLVTLNFDPSAEWQLIVSICFCNNRSPSGLAYSNPHMA